MKPNVYTVQRRYKKVPDSKVLGANMGLTWVLLAPDGLHIGPINLAIWSNFSPNPPQLTPITGEL